MQRPTGAPTTTKRPAARAPNPRHVYLVAYNLFMFVAFLALHLALLAGLVPGAQPIGPATFVAIRLLTCAQLLEALHPALGLVAGGPLMPLVQTLGRLLVSQLLAEPAIRSAAAASAHHLFIVWSMIEIFRYSFYALRLFKLDIYPLTWCRYTLFLPLYPMGGYYESRVILSSASHYETTSSYSIGLPNAANFSFSLPVLLRLYTFVLLGPAILYLMRYMWAQRCKQLRAKVV